MFKECLYTLYTWSGSIKEFLNILYLLSGPVLAVITFLALRQITIAKKQLEFAKKSLEINSKREAAIFTAKQCEFYASNIIQEYSTIIKKFEEKDIELFTLPKDKDTLFGCEYSDWLNKYLEKIFDNNQELYFLITTLLNDIELFSIYFMHKICDVDMAYSPVARTYVTIIEGLSPMICFLKSKEKVPYLNALRLYDIWKKRLIKSELDLKQKELYKQFMEAREQASCVIEEEIKPFGLDDID